MKTINAFAILLDGEVRRKRVYFKNTYLGYRYTIVKKTHPPILIHLMFCIPLHQDGTTKVNTGLLSVAIELPSFVGM